MSNPLATEEHALSATQSTDVESSEFLVRARGEVLKALAGVLQKRLPVTVTLIPGMTGVRSVLLAMDEAAGSLLLECPDEWRVHIESAEGNDAVLVCADEDSKIQFQSGRAELDVFEGRPAARIAVPTFIWRFQRRADRRYSAPALKIMLNLGFSESEAEIADLSMSGVGLINCDADVNLEQGEVLKDCAIALPGVGKVTTDLEVVHQTLVHIIGGGTINRVGCRFGGLSAESRYLISQYLGTLAEV